MVGVCWIVSKNIWSSFDRFPLFNGNCIILVAIEKGDHKFLVIVMWVTKSFWLLQGLAIEKIWSSYIMVIELFFGHHKVNFRLL
jgi:hypothetical protein